MDAPSNSAGTQEEFFLIDKLRHLERVIEDAVVHILDTNTRPPDTVDCEIHHFRISILTFLGRAEEKNKTVPGMSSIEQNIQVAMGRYYFYHLIAYVAETEHAIASHERAIRKPHLIWKGFYGLLWLSCGYNRKDVLKRSIQDQILSIISALRKIIGSPYFSELSIEAQESFRLTLERYFKRYYEDIASGQHNLPK